MIEDQRIISYFTLREDGNMSFSRDASPENVRNRFKAVAEKLGTDYSSMVCGHQTHGINVGIVRAEHRGSGISKPLCFDETDALITDVPGIALCTIHADCIPVQFWDPGHNTIGAAHSGWRGTLGEIASCVVGKMSLCFGTLPEKLIAHIGPGICGDCFEISADVYEAFHGKFPELCAQEKFLRKGLMPGKWKLNLKAFVRESLLHSGVLPENITVSQDCTCCMEEKYFSHRRDGNRPVPKGAMSSIIAIKKQELC